MKYSNVTLGRVEAVWNKLGGEEGVDCFLRGELTISKLERKWREQDGVVYFSVTSDGTTGTTGPHLKCDILPRTIFVRGSFYGRIE